MLTSTISQRIEISTGPPNYIRPAFPEHAATSPVPLKELLPNDLKNIFDSDLEGNEDVEVVDMLLAHLLMTAQPADDIIISETEPESDEEVTIVRFQLAAGPSHPLTVLPSKDLSITEPESDEEPQLATVSMRMVSHPSPIANKQSRLASNMPSSRKSDAFLFNHVFLILLVTHSTVVYLLSCHKCLSLNCYPAVQYMKI